MFQLNLFSLTGLYGKGVKKKAMFLLRQQFIVCVGTDFHHYNYVKK